MLDACFHYVLHPAILQVTDNRSIFLPSKLRKFSFYAAPKPGSLVYSHYILREWTPGGSSLLRVWHELTRIVDTRVCDLTVYDDTGSVLVAMTGFELKRSSTLPFPGIKRRYEVALQPVVTSAAPPRCPANWSRPDKETADLIVTIADHEAQLLLRRSLDRGVIVGDDLNRQRYYQFAKDAITRRLPPLPSPAVVEDIKTKWPIRFQVIDRLSQIHHEVFESSAVSLYLLRGYEAFLIYNTPGNCSSSVL